MSKNLKLAIVRLSAMGDIIHSASVLPSLLDALKEHYTINLSWFVDSIFKEILEDSPCVNEIIPLPLKETIQTKDFKALYHIYKTLKKESFDIVIDMQGLLKSAIIAKTLKTKSIFGFQSPKESLAKFLYDTKVSIPYSSHILLRNATLTFSAFHLPIPSIEKLKSPKQFLGFKPIQLSCIPKNPLQKKILCVLETSKINKTYPIDKFLELAQLLNLKEYIPIFLTQKPIEIPKKAKFYHIHSLNLTQIKSLVTQMDLVIGGDTGITHLAWAFQCPSITLFGATPKERFNLNTTKNLSLSSNPNANYDKSDFSIHTISPNAILNLAEQLLKKEI